ncbi:hypothetical protein PVAP13_8NG256900 [Panicum virgatum]|uniref:Uncharacterized protein n=1 Tax=Panicum virgatum TaxID=38727 RepID=A0A8T0P9M2_PANVG|nr:hypothetical protein PVAP13_8NG256900 [Panicum virgatum]
MPYYASLKAPFSRPRDLRSRQFRGCPDAAGAGGRCRGAVAGAAAAAGLDPCPQVHRTPQQVQGAAATAGPWDAAAGPGLPRCRSRSTIAEERLEDSWAPLDETVATEELEEMIHSKEAHTNAVNLESFLDVWFLWSTDGTSIYIIVNWFALKNIEALVCFSIVLWSVHCIILYAVKAPF